MPIYEYECRGCNCIFETFVWSAKDEGQVQCPKCTCGDVKRVLSAFCTAASGIGEGISGSGCGPGSGGFS